MVKHFTHDLSLITWRVDKGRIYFIAELCEVEIKNVFLVIYHVFLLALYVNPTYLQYRFQNRFY